MKNLVPAYKLVDSSLDCFRTGNPSNELKRILALLYRLQPNCENYFEDFRSYIEKLAYYDDEFSFYSDLRIYLARTFNVDNPLDAVYTRLNKKGYSKSDINSMRFSPDEQKFVAALPSKRNFLYILIFYLHSPQKTMKFFMENMTAPLTKEEYELLKAFRRLNDENQARVLSYAKNWAK